MNFSSNENIAKLNVKNKILAKGKINSNKWIISNKSIRFGQGIVDD